MRHPLQTHESRKSSRHNSFLLRRSPRSRRVACVCPISKQQKQASKTRQPSALPLFGMNVNKPGRGRPPANAQWDPQPGQPSGCWRHTVTGEPIHSHERARFQNSMHRHPQMGAKKVRSQCGRVEPRNVLRDCVRRSPSHSPQPLPRFTVTTYKIADDGIV